MSQIPAVVLFRLTQAVAVLERKNRHHLGGLKILCLPEVKKQVLREFAAKGQYKDDVLQETASSLESMILPHWYESCVLEVEGFLEDQKTPLEIFEEDWKWFIDILKSSRTHPGFNLAEYSYLRQRENWRIKFMEANDKLRSLMNNHRPVVE